MTVLNKGSHCHEIRRSPRISDPLYLILKSLDRQLSAKAVQLEREGRKDQIIIDIGCGDKPYLEWFVSLSRAYWGIDFSDNSSADVLGSANNLPFKDAVADIVLCTQVIEHCKHPDKVLFEICRILKPGGIVLLSTHGVYIYHPVPNDYWRWTHEGLQVVLKAAGVRSSSSATNWWANSLFVLSYHNISFRVYSSKPMVGPDSLVPYFPFQHCGRETR